MANNKNKIHVKWPKTTFTIQKLQELNPTVKNITLRFKLKKQIEAGDLTSVGKNPSSMGRPTLVFAKSDVSNETLLKLKKSGVILEESYEKRLTESTSTVVATFTGNQTSTETEETPLAEKKTEEAVPATV